MSGECLEFWSPSGNPEEMPRHMYNSAGISKTPALQKPNLWLSVGCRFDLATSEVTVLSVCSVSMAKVERTPSSFPWALPSLLPLLSEFSGGDPRAHCHRPATNQS